MVGLHRGWAGDSSTCSGVSATEDGVSSSPAAIAPAASTDRWLLTAHIQVAPAFSREVAVNRVTARGSAI